MDDGRRPGEQVAVEPIEPLGDVPGHAIRMLDEPEAIRRAIARAVTDSGNEIRFSEDPARAGVANLLGIYQAITGKTADAVEAEFAATRGYGNLKRTVADVVVAELTPIRERHETLMREPGELDRLLARGASRARAVADPKRREMKRGRACSCLAETSAARSREVQRAQV